MYTKRGNLFEKLMSTRNIHIFEDFLRHKMITSSDELDKNEILVLSRILWGRILNSTKDTTKMLDSRHSKAQMITILCLFFYLFRPKSEKNKDLLNLLIYHLNKINEYLVSCDFDSLSSINQKYYIYCNKWTKYCDIILNNNKYPMSNNINSVSMILNKPIIEQIDINKKISDYLESLNVNDFL